MFTDLLDTIAYWYIKVRKKSTIAKMKNKIFRDIYIYIYIYNSIVSKGFSWLTYYKKVWYCEKKMLIEAAITPEDYVWKGKNVSWDALNLTNCWTRKVNWFLSLNIWIHFFLVSFHKTELKWSIFIFYANFHRVSETWKITKSNVSFWLVCSHHIIWQILKL